MYAHAINTRLTLGELGRTTGFAETGLLTFDHTAVTGKKVGVLEDLIKTSVVHTQGTGNAELAGAGLTGDPTAADADDDVHFVFFARFSQRSQNGVALLHGAEVIFKAAAIDRDEALAGTDTNAGDSGFTTTGSERVVVAFAFDDDFNGWCYKKY